jgi:hypothetical protein
VEGELYNSHSKLGTVCGRFASMLLAWSGPADGRTATTASDAALAWTATGPAHDRGKVDHRKEDVLHHLLSRRRRPEDGDNGDEPEYETQDGQGKDRSDPSGCQRQCRGHAPIHSRG